MADELELELENDEEIISRGQDRNKKLADKVIVTSKERDDALEKANKAEQDRISSEKERDFYKDFNKIATKYQGATEYQDKILEKVNAGYDVEDATISILAKEGKYVPEVPKTENEKAAGGSASTSMKGGGSKEPEEMTQDERGKALREIEARGELKL